MLFQRIQAMLQACDSDSPLFPPTELFNENWMLRILLDWYATYGRNSSLLGFVNDANWYSEALLPSPFRPRHRKDPLSESHTHADGVIGQFKIGGSGKGDLVLSSQASQLVVLEGKMFSPLSFRVTNSPTFDQAARSVACIAEILRIARRPPAQLAALGFYVVAPASQIDKGVFADKMMSTSIQRKVQQRIEPYAGALDEWLHKWFEPTIQHIVLRCISWEELITGVAQADETAGREISEFYVKCKQFNQRFRQKTPA